MIVRRTLSLWLLPLNQPLSLPRRITYRTMSLLSSAEIVELKKDLRKQVRAKLRALSTQEIDSQSQAACDRLLQLPAYQQAKTIGVFLSMPTGEIRTDPIILNAAEQHKELYVPHVGSNFELCDMELVKVVAYTTLDTNTTSLFHCNWPRNKWGIPEPPNVETLSRAQPGSIDVLIVPGLAFDAAGNRLGQGKGYYDRFIAKMKTADKKPLLVAVGLQCQFLTKDHDAYTIPTNEYDQSMDFVLLPDQTIACARNVL
jgi:5-formyltetrahydrofolate cyclo-ligase